MRWKLHLFLLVVATVLPALGSLAQTPVAAAASTASSWTSPHSYTIDYLGRDGPGGTDHYLIQIGWGATLFGIALNSMPLVPPEQAVTILANGYGPAFPGQPIQDLQPGESFGFYVPAGTVVSERWRPEGNITEYRSLRGDTLWLHTGPNDPISYRLVQADNPGQEEVKLGDKVDQRPYQLAQRIFGQGNTNFKPDFIQVWQAQQALQSSSKTLTVDLSKTHLDSFQDIKGSAQAGGKNAEGLNIYWFHSPTTT